MVSMNVDYINLYSTCEICGFAFLIPRTGSFVCKWLRPSEERNHEQIKEQEKALFNGLPSPSLSSWKNISRISSAFLPRLLILCALPRRPVALFWATVPSVSVRVDFKAMNQPSSDYSNQRNCCISFMLSIESKTSFSFDSMKIFFHWTRTY